MPQESDFSKRGRGIPGPAAVGIAVNVTPIEGWSPVRRDWGALLRRRIARLRDIRTGAEAWLFLKALAFAVGVPVRLRQPWTALDAGLERRFPRSRPELSVTADGARIVACVEGALEVGRPLVRPGCLTRGLSLYYFLRRAGIPVTLCFGARLQGGRLVAEPGHCWLESAGEPILERTDPRASFVPLCRFPGVTAGSNVLRAPQSADS